MKTRYGISPWVYLFPDSRRPSLPVLKGERTTDVVIIGGGLTGVATAHACAMAGLRPLLVEADRIGQGSAGRSAGLLLPDPGPMFRSIVGAHGLRAGRTVFESWRKASLDAAATLRRAGVKCNHEPVDGLLVAFGADEKLLRKEHDAREAAGLPVRWLTQKQVRSEGTLDAAAALATRDAFALDPYRACLGLASAAARRGAKLFEKSPVKSVSFDRAGVEVTLDAATVRAKTVVVTTGTATREFKPLQRHFKSREAYFALTEPLPAAVRKQVLDASTTLGDISTPPHRVRWALDGRLLVAGASQDEPPARVRDAVLRQRTGQLMYELLMMYPAISGHLPEFGWELKYGESADGLMYIGPHRNYPHHLFALGGAGDSVTGALLAAKILLRSLRGETQKGDEVFGWTR